MEAWVIKRKDGKYYSFGLGWVDDICKSWFSRWKDETKRYIRDYQKLKGCNPVKVRIEEVEE